MTGENLTLKMTGLQFIALTLRSQGKNEATTNDIAQMFNLDNPFGTAIPTGIDQIVTKLTEKYELDEEAQTALKEALAKIDSTRITNSTTLEIPAVPDSMISKEEFMDEEYVLNSSDKASSYVEDLMANGENGNEILSALCEVQEEAIQETESETIAETESETEATTKSETLPDETLSESETIAETESETIAETESETMAETESETEAATKSETLPDETLSESETIAETESETEAAIESETETEEDTTTDQTTEDTTELPAETEVTEEDTTTDQATEDTTELPAETEVIEEDTTEDSTDTEEATEADTQTESSSDSSEDLITKYKNTDYKSFIYTKAGTLNSDEMPDGFSLTSSENGLYECDGKTYKKVNPAYINNFGVHELKTEGDNIVDKDGNIVGVVYENSDGTVSFYILDTLKTTIEKANDDEDDTTSSGSDSTGETASDKNQKEYTGDKEYFENLGYELKNGKVYNDGKVIGAYETTDDDKVRITINEDDAIKGTKSQDNKDENGVEKGHYEDKMNTDGTTITTIYTKNGSYTIKTSLDDDEVKIESIVSGNSTITDKDKIAQMLSEIAGSVTDGDTLARMLEMGVMEYIQKESEGDIETEQLKTVINQLNSNDNFKKFAEYQDDGNEPYKDYIPDDYKENGENSSATLRKGVFEALKAYKENQDSNGSKGLSAEATLYLLNKYSGGDIDTLVDLFRQDSSALSGGKKDQENYLQVLYELIYAANFATSET